MEKTPTVKIHNLDYMKEILQRTYGNFGIDRSSSKCFGLNTFTSKVNSLYILEKGLVNPINSKINDG